MRTIYRTLSLADAEMLRAELRARGIESALHNEHGAMLAAGIPIPAIPFEVAVADDHADAALRTVRDLFSRKATPSAPARERLVFTPCLSCGKTLEVLDGEDGPSECPWCGQDPSRRPPPPERRSKALKWVVVPVMGRFEEAAPAEAAAARTALMAYRTRLEARLAAAGPARLDPRWLDYLVRGAEHTGLRPADLARSLREEADEALRELNASGPGGAREPPERSFGELLKACINAHARAREIALKDGYREAAGTVRVEVAPPHVRSWPGNARYASRLFAPVLHPRLYVEPWPDPESPRPGLSPESLLLVVQAETWPGRHLWRLRARAHASLMKRAYGSGIAETGWAAYVSQEVADVPKRERLLARWRDAWWGLLDLAVAGGALTEDEAVEFLQEWGGLELPEARRAVAFLTSYPFQYAGAAWTAREIRRLREDVAKSSAGAFDLRRFHESVMDFGSTPIALIRKEMLGKK